MSIYVCLFENNVYFHMLAGSSIHYVVGIDMSTMFDMAWVDVWMSIPRFDHVLTVALI